VGRVPINPLELEPTRRSSKYETQGQTLRNIIGK
jgi:hypothetical protein